MLQISWSRLLNAIYTESVGIEISEEERIHVIEPEYLKNLVRLLDATDPRIIGKLEVLNFKQTNRK